jgi:hypothetical protein
MSHVRPHRRGSLRLLLVTLAGSAALGGGLMTTTAVAEGAVPSVVPPNVAAATIPGTVPSVPCNAACATASATTPTYSLEGIAPSVKTSDGMSWSFQPSAYVPPGEGLAINGISLTRTVTTGGTGYETHEWDFDDTPAIFSFTVATKTATLNTGTQDNPVADLDMTFKGTSSKDATCTTGSETVYTGTMSGSFSLVTGLTGGGTISSSDLSLPSAVLTVDTECVPPTTATSCTSEAGTSFVSNSTPGLFADGIYGSVEGTKLSAVSVARFTDLTSPAGASRGDIDSIDASRATFKDKVLSVTTSSAGLVTGSATLSKGKSKTISTPCTSGGKTYTVKTVEDQKATFTSPAGSPITSTPNLGPPITAPSPSKTAAYDVTTVKAS